MMDKTKMFKEKDNDAGNVLLIGWDGATFDIIEPLIAQGRLPNIASLMKDGVWARLKSTIPPLTPVAWTSISTGVNPGKHGIYDAMVYIPALKKITFVNSTLRKIKPIWSILSDHRKKVGVMNIPVTYPPDEVNGFLISGMFTPDGVADFIYPPGLKAEIENKFGRYRIDCAQDDNPSIYLKSILDVEVDFREKAASYLMDRYALNFFFVVFMASDRVQHFYWKYLDPSHPEHHKYGDAIAVVYERMDQALGRLLKKTGSDTNVLIVSDHGAGPLTSAFFLNNWLIKNGYLYFKEDPAIAFNKKRPSRVKSQLIKSIKKVIPSAILDKIKPRGDGAHQEEINLFYSLIDWDKTVAFSEGAGGGIYINPETVKPEKYNEVLSRIIQGFYNLTDPYGKKVVKNVYQKNDIYSGEYLVNAPDLTVICNEGYQIIAPNEFLYFNKEYEDTLFLSHRWSGRHEEHGIFLLKGPAVKKNIKIDGCRIIDIAPTILYLMNEAIPEYMDGKVLLEVIDEEYLSNNPVHWTSDTIQQDRSGQSFSKNEENEIRDKLKNLGYIE